jgi:hypothetical protein
LSCFMRHFKVRLKIAVQFKYPWNLFSWVENGVVFLFSLSYPLCPSTGTALPSHSRWQDHNPAYLPHLPCLHQIRPGGSSHNSKERIIFNLTRLMSSQPESSLHFLSAGSSRLTSDLLALHSFACRVLIGSSSKLPHCATDTRKLTGRPDARLPIKFKRQSTDCARTFGS